jgi:hypothetical protein
LRKKDGHDKKARVMVGASDVVMIHSSAVIPLYLVDDVILHLY